jgi:membrane-associated phospholipid phosphatase
MPPWMAADLGLIPPVENVMGRAVSLFDRGPGLPTLYVLMAPNQVAAMPSLHAAYPAMVYLFAVKHFGWKGNLFLPYALTVWVGIVYTAQHWVIDVTVGIAYALVVFGATVFFARRSRSHRSPPALTADPTGV